MKCNINLRGTLMYKDTPLATFLIEHGEPVEFVPLSTDVRLFPFEMVERQSGCTLVDALVERAVPETRQGLLEELNAVGIKGYDISAILKHQNASSVEDANWVRFTDGPQTWEQLLQKLGYDIAGEVHARWKGGGMGDYRCSWCDNVVSQRVSPCPMCGAIMD